MERKLKSQIQSVMDLFFIILFDKIFARDFITGAKIFKIPGLRQIGSNYGGWIVPTDLLNPGSVCYCAGVGEDITFDLGLISRYGCEVYALDPTPRSRIHVKKYARNLNQFNYLNVGLWDKNEIVKFYAHSNPASPSFSIVNLHQTVKFLEAPCKRLSTIMKENRHRKIDLLKLDIEGAEYQVVDSLIEDQLDIGIILVEYDEIHSRHYDGYPQRIRKSVKRLCNYGYTLVALKPKSNYTFVKKEILISYMRRNGVPLTAPCS